MLSVTHLGKTYANGAQALDNVSFDVNAGEILAIVGGSGCGKSTLLRLISGLDQPTSGGVHLRNDLITMPHPLINLIFQEPRLLPWLRVTDNIGFGIRHLDSQERKGRIAEVLETVHLNGYGNRWPKELSGGQAQRVALARALVTRPEVLLLDEPFSALDAMTRGRLQQHLLDIWQATQATMVIVTHDIDEAIALAHRVIVMKPRPGRISEEIHIDLPMRREHGMDYLVPYQQRLKSALNHSMAFA
ncbi:nitrate/sulfonate/bicarbonate ABC transporter ATP-binding protein (plasmid) [Agrobacterium vitis]|uniref:ABC transporter ATP-binding protein n=1 Tax=Agrobacterium vitis TaxID=373 RepID=UPI0015D998C0|nr:ABC transporter ATP-binding protein [Agrobacterium vitis]BCH67595.1 nitrate/sulfonate/bicarbonate ABC transporter ATP-binding protein [Agrobacterium vitis]